MTYQGKPIEEYLEEHNHPIFNDRRSQSAGVLMAEFGAMIEGGLTNRQWVMEMTREERALRVAFAMGKNIQTQLRLYDDKKERERK